jgi:exopolysaccharide biosynthesis polyprenyl glycosylphosphotransferase
MLKQRSLWLPVLLDVVGLTAAFVMASQVLPVFERLFLTAYQSPGLSVLWPALAVCFLVLLPILILTDAYGMPRHWGGFRILRSLTVSHAALVVIYLLGSILFPDAFLPARKAVLVTAPFSILILWYWRRIYPSLFTRVDRKRRALLVGAHTYAIRALQRFQREHGDEFEIIGVVEDFRTGSYFETIGIEHCGTSQHLKTVLRTRPVDTIVVLTDQSQYAGKIIDVLGEFPTVRGVYVRAQVPLAVAQDIDLLFIQEVPLLKVYSSGPKSTFNAIRDGIDRAAAGFALFCLAPVFGLVALLIKLDSPGPVFYRQRRLGRHNEPFWIYKFRSMVVNAEQKSGAVLAQKNDPRVTRVGRVLRMLRIDELPQFLNVFRGEMSMIGPRPERPEFQNIYRDTISWYPLRSMLKPGITGLAQVTGDYHTSAQRKLLYDVTYLANMGFILDLRIVAATVLTVLTKKGH